MFPIQIAQFNGLAPQKCGSNLTSVFFAIILRIDVSSTSCQFGFRSVSQNFIDEKATLLCEIA